MHFLCADVLKCYTSAYISRIYSKNKCSKWKYTSMHDFHQYLL